MHSIGWQYCVVLMINAGSQLSSNIHSSTLPEKAIVVDKEEIYPTGMCWFPSVHLVPILCNTLTDSHLPAPPEPNPQPFRFLCPAVSPATHPPSGSVVTIFAQLFRWAFFMPLLPLCLWVLPLLSTTWHIFQGLRAWTWMCDHALEFHLILSPSSQGVHSCQLTQ